MLVEILRGIPGSGKSTYAEKKTRIDDLAVQIVSADSYHYVDGVYKFKSENLSEAHKKCKKDFHQYIQEKDLDLLIVDNTNITRQEFEPYYLAAIAAGHEIEIVTFLAPLEQCIHRNVHGVPADKVFQMYQNLLSTIIPTYYKHRIVLCTSTD